MTKLRVAKSELTFISFLKDFWTFCHPHDLLISICFKQQTCYNFSRLRPVYFSWFSEKLLHKLAKSLLICCLMFSIFFREIENQNLRFLFLNLRGIIFEFEWQTKDFEQITDKYWFLKAPAGLLKFCFSEKLFRNLAKSLFICCCKCFLQVTWFSG